MTNQRLLSVWLRYLVVLSLLAHWWTGSVLEDVWSAAAIMWSPGLAAILAVLSCRLPVASLGLVIPSPRWLVAAWLLPLLYSASAYAPCWLLWPETGLDTPAREWLAGKYGGTTEWALARRLLQTGTLAMPVSLVLALGEELGWRGLLFPLLSKMGSLRWATVGSGLLWAVWHYPIILLGNYHSQSPLGWQLLCFSAMCLGMSLVMGWLRQRSASVWPAVVLHASHNCFVQQFFDLASAGGGAGSLWLTEFGAGLAVTTVAAGLVLVWRWPAGTPSGAWDVVPLDGGVECP